jgi:hypothetical protein
MTGGDARSHVNPRHATQPPASRGRAHPPGPEPIGVAVSGAPPRRVVDLYDFVCRRIPLDERDVFEQLGQGQHIAPRRQQLVAGRHAVRVTAPAGLDPFGVRQQSLCVRRRGAPCRSAQARGAQRSLGLPVRLQHLLAVRLGSRTTASASPERHHRTAGAAHDDHRQTQPTTPTARCLRPDGVALRPRNRGCFHAVAPSSGSRQDPPRRGGTVPAGGGLERHPSELRPEVHLGPLVGVRPPNGRDTTRSDVPAGESHDHPEWGGPRRAPPSQR